MSRYMPGSGCAASWTSPSATSWMAVLAGKRFWARPIRPLRKLARICSCCAAVEAVGLQQRAQAVVFRRLSPWRAGAPGGAACGRMRSNRVWTMPLNSGRVRHASAKAARSARWLPGRRSHVLLEHLRHDQRVVARRHQAVGLARRILTAQQFGVRAALVDGEVIHHGIHGERQRVFQFALGATHDVLQPVLGALAPAPARR